MKKENNNINSNIRYFVVSQNMKEDGWSIHITFLRFVWKENEGVEEQYESYPHRATQFRTEVEALNYAFALNYRARRNEYENDRYYVISIDISQLPKIIESHWNEEMIDTTDTDSVSEPSDDGNGETA